MTMEERLATAEEKADRAERTSIASANGLLAVEQQMGRVEREMRDLRSTVAVGLTSVRDAVRELREDVRSPRKTTELSLSEEDFQETPTGSFKVTKDTVVRILGEVEKEEDAKKWRALWRRFKWFVFLIIGGGATFGGERLFEFLSKHL